MAQRTEGTETTAPPKKEVIISVRQLPDAPHGAMPIISIRAGRYPDVYRTQNRNGGKTPKNLVSKQSQKHKHCAT